MHFLDTRLALDRFALLVCAALFINGCATQRSPQNSPQSTPQVIHQQHLATLANIQAFSLKGRLGVVTQKKGFSGSIDWQHLPSADDIKVYSPLGGQVAHIEKNSSTVKLTSSDGKILSAPDAETLTETALGFRLPLTGLSDWALGRPSNSKIDAITWDEQGRISTLKQDGWDINYENYAEIGGGANNNVFVPNKIVLKSEKVNLKLLVENWADLKN